MSELEDRAFAEFSDLTSAEKTLLAAAARGLAADYGRIGSTDGSKRSAWGESRTIRAELLRWLCVNKDAAECVDLRGVVISSAKVVGQLDLAYASLHFPLTIVDSTISDGIVLSHAESRLISLDGTYCGPINAHSLAVRGGISLHGFRALGPVILSGAVVSDDLDCGGAHLLNRGGIALNAENSSIGGSVRMDKGFRAIGSVNLREAAIGVSFDCSGGVFLSRDGIVLLASGVRVGGSAIFDDGFRTNGMVVLQRATIATDLSFRRAIFTGKKFGGADLSRAAVEGRFAWLGIQQTADTTLDLTDAEFDQIADEEASWPASDHFAVEGCRYRTIASGFTQLDARLRMMRKMRPFAPQA